MQQKLMLNHDDLVRFCRKHHIRRMALFGSVLKGTSGPDSDVDLLVDFASDGISAHKLYSRPKSCMRADDAIRIRHLNGSGRPP